MTLWETDDSAEPIAGSQEILGQALRSIPSAASGQDTALETDSPGSAEATSNDTIASDAQARRSRLAGLKRLRRLIVTLGLLLSGLLIGWLVIGWWLWPIEWTNTSPWDLRADYQKTYVDLVATDYWESGNVLKAKKSLSGWDDQSLAELLATMYAQSPDFETRQRLSALIEVLRLPDYQASPFSSLFGDKIIILSMFLSISPLIVALGLVLSPMVKEKAKQSDGFLGQIMGPLIEESTGAPGELLDQAGQYEGTTPGESPDQTEGEEEEAATAEATGAAAGEEEEEEEDDEDDDDDDWWEEDEEENSDASVGDILMSLFEEDDSELPQLKAIAKDLPDVEMGDLLEKGHHLAEQLEKSNQLRSAQRRQ